MLFSQIHIHFLFFAMTTIPGTYFTEQQLEAARKGNGGDFYFYTLIPIKLINMFIQLMRYVLYFALVLINGIVLDSYMTMRGNSMTKHWRGIF